MIPPLKPPLPKEGTESTGFRQQRGRWTKRTVEGKDSSEEEEASRHRLVTRSEANVRPLDLFDNGWRQGRWYKDEARGLFGTGGDQG